MLICCHTLTHAGRRDRLERSLRCLAAQTQPYVNHVRDWTESGGTCGHNRNRINQDCGAMPSAVTHIAHWDDDDYSHPYRLQHQKLIMETTGADIVGYNEIPILDETNGEVWIYKHPTSTWVFDTTMMYRRECWDEIGNEFEDTNTGVETKWLRKQRNAGRHIVGVSGLIGDIPMVVACMGADSTNLRRSLEKAKTLDHTFQGWLPAPSDVELSARAVVERVG